MSSPAVSKAKPEGNKAKPSGNNLEPTTNKAEPKPLNKQQQAFVQEFLKDRNATQAAIRAGYSQATARQIGARLLRHVHIKDACAEAEREHLARIQRDTGISLERTLTEIARIAYFDPRKMFDKEGAPLPITELDDDTAAVIAGLEVLEEWEGTGRDRVLVGHIKKWKLSDKKGALDMLMKNLGGYATDNTQKSDALADLLGRVQGSAIKPKA